MTHSTSKTETAKPASEAQPAPSLPATSLPATSLPATSLPATYQGPPAHTQASSRAKNRFSLDILRIPFISSPRKPSSSGPVDKPDNADPLNTESVTSLGSDSTAPTATSEALTSSTSSTHAAPTSTAQMSEHDAASEQLAPPNELRPRRSALSSSADASSRRASRTMSPHRVSFSPSTEEVAEAREHALSLASLAPPTQPKHINISGDKHPSSKSKAKSNFAKWRGFKSRSTSDLTTTSCRLSLDSTLTVSSAASSSTSERFEDRAALPGAAAAKRRLFRWDRKGIHHSSPSEKGKVAKVKVTKHQALAARHAKTLEQVINAGMGLHPVPPRVSSALETTSAGSPQQLTKQSKKKKVPRAKPIPVVDRSQLKGLKSALLDVDLANNIISELRSMPVPLDALRSGLGKMLPDVQIGTAGEHGQERILTANLPDTALQGQATKDDSEIRKRPGASLQALDAATPALERPRMERNAKSAAEEALRKITLQAEASIPPHKALVTARTSSLPPSVEEAASNTTALATPAPAAPSPKTGPAASGARPLKMVCLDCGEAEAHRRHADHLEAAAVVTSTKSDDTEPTAGFSVANIATGAAAALAGVGGLINSPAAPPTQATDSEKEPSPSARPPMLKSMSVANLPTLQDGQRLMGSTPLQLLMDPVGTAAQNSGAFDVLANVSGAAIRATQDMDSIHPPLDRMAIFVHWWGFEITLPKASMAYLGTAHSVSGAFLSFLQTMAVGGGVPELLPFIKYISTFMEVEYKAIQAQDQGHGVCIAGTWFMPLALVPRPWDYPLDGPTATTPAAGTKSAPLSTIASDTTPVTMPGPAGSNDSAASPRRHAFKKIQPSDTQTSDMAAIAQVAVLGKGAPPQQPTVLPKRNLSPSQMAAIQAARTEKIPPDLSPRHSRASSIASSKSAKLFADSTAAATVVTGVQVEAALASVEEMSEVGSLRIKA
ncbi:uncharacterized protein UTRI_02209_B [Ustilago trichophora]|uniref:Uncharacterized protein n=1 Tax=Ustilago trichophora TaxID=86804 RepID=A0A5C3DYL3_9BASI|nr:uncharacterized protein UTRI_02209_B [Ustilago trichophora]